MAGRDKPEMTIANRSDTTRSEVTIWNKDSFGVTLGDLRKLVQAAEGMPDEAEVTVEELRAHYSLRNRHMAKRISARCDETRRVTTIEAEVNDDGSEADE